MGTTDNPTYRRLNKPHRKIGIKRLCLDELSYFTPAIVLLLTFYMVSHKKPEIGPFVTLTNVCGVSITFVHCLRQTQQSGVLGNNVITISPHINKLYR